MFNLQLIFPGGGLEVYMMGGGGGADIFFWVQNLHAQYFWGQGICHIFF